MKNTEFTLIDLETTGLSKHRHKITEIAAIKIKDGKEISRFEQLVNPEEPIPKFITRLTGITDSMVQNKPTIKDVMPSLVDFLGESVIVAHNATFDYGFLSHNAELALGEELANKKICTKKLASRLLPDLPSKKLGTICDYFEIVNNQAHRAMADTEATVEVFNKFSELMEKEGITEFSAVAKFECSPIKR